MITVTVVSDINYEADVNLSACDGNAVIYEGDEYFPGTDTTLNFVTQFGCDSIINLTVAAFPTSHKKF